MALSRSKAEKHGLAFSVEGEASPSAPDQKIWVADITIAGHTEHFVGKSAEDIIEQAERVLIANGWVDSDSSGVGEAEPARAQKSDVAALEAFRG